LPPIATAPAAAAWVELATVGELLLPPEPMETVLTALAWLNKPTATLLWPNALACTPTAVARLPALLMKPKAVPYAPVTWLPAPNKVTARRPPPLAPQPATVE